MEGRGRSRARKKPKFFSPKRLTSFLLAAAMVCTNIGSDLSTAYAAGTSSEVTFEMRGADLTAAVEEAIASENVVTPDDLNFTNGKVDEFKGYLFGEGKLYEAYPEMEGGDVEADMRVFVRVPEDADDMYAVTGDEEVIFLYINNSDETVRFRSLINYMVDGEEKVKKTESVTVRSYESVYGDEEVNVISDPVEEVPETAAPETEAPAEEVPEVPETEAPEDPTATESEMTVSMSRNEAALVAAPGEEATPSEWPEETDAEVPETEAPETSAPAEETAPAEEETAAEETSEAVENVPEETVPAEDQTATPSETPAATDSEIESAPKPSYSDLVGIGWSSTAKVYASTLNRLHALDDVEGWKVEYSITPEGSARIVDGARGVEDGEDLYFGVKNQIGYAVETVLANGEELTADTITDNEDGSQTAWYAVYGVTEEQSIDVVMAETGEHPAFDQTLVMDDGMQIIIKAEAGVLPAGVEATAERVSQEVEAAVVESASAEGKNLTSVYAYDINLWLNGQLLDSEIWGGSKRVQVTFSGDPVKEASEQASAVEVLHVETVQDTDQEAKEKAAVQEEEIKAEDVLGVETVSEVVEVPAEESVDAVSFEAEHFTVYAVAARAGAETKYVGDTWSVEARDGDKNYFWETSNSSVVKIVYSDPGRAGYIYSYNGYANLEAVGTGQATITLYNQRHNSISTFSYVVTDERVYTFHPNGANGTDYTITAEGNSLELPRLEDTGFERSGYVFVGWSTNSSGQGNNYTPQTIENVGGQTDWYAIWTPENARGNYEAEFYIRVNGTIPYEPDASIGQGGVGYAPGGCGSGNGIGMTGTVKTSIAINNNLELVADNLGETPSDEAIQAAIRVYNQNHRDDPIEQFDPETQEVVWYVIKKNDDHYHVDGVIRDIEKNYVKYDPNGGTSDVLPAQPYREGEQVDVYFETLPTRPGYTFIGWDEDPHTTTPEYTEGGLKTFTMPDHDVTLYAIWQEKDAVTLKYVAVGGGTVYPGSEKVRPDTGVPQGSTATANEGYTFDGWYGNEDCTDNLSKDNHYVPEKEGDLWTEKTYYAHFTPNTDISYTVEYETAEGEKLLPDKEVGNQTMATTVTEQAPEIAGYTVDEGTKSLKLAAEGNVITFIYTPNTDTKYTVEWYYQQYDGTYSKAPTYTDEREGTTDTEVTVTDADKNPNAGFAYDESADNVEKGIIAGDGTLVLKLYFYRATYNFEVVEHYIDADNNEIDQHVTPGTAKFEEAILELSGVTVTQNKEYEGNNYYLTGVDGYDKLVSADETQNEVHIYYALDNVGGKDPENPENPDIPDGVPDMYQVEVTYEAVNGTVDVTDTQYVTIYKNGDATGNWATPSEMAWGYLSDEQIADATANTGYDQTTELWTLDGKATVKPDTESQIREDRHYVITFEKGMYNYLVVEHYENADGEEVGKVETPGTAAFEEAILELSGVIVTQNKEYKGDNYTLIRVDGYDKLVSVDETQNEVHIYYTLDNIGGGEDPENPDDIPDKYQLKFTYTSEDPEKGTVTGKTTEVKTFVDEAGNYTEVQPTSPNTMDGHNPVPEAKDGYAFAYWTEAGQDERDYSLNMTYTLGQKEYTEDTTFVAHFLKDEGGKEDPNQPDGTPDEYQIKFTYVTEDPAHGTFGGVNEVSEVLDRPTNEDGSTNMEKGVSPTVNVTITENGRYRFDHWTDAAGTEYTTEELQKATFTADATFTAHFRYISSSGGNGGSSGSGGGTGPYTPSTGGPGAAIIDDDNVPLAPLPTENNGGNVVIFDDSVPLAPLPKTGQQSSKTPVTMLLTGIFLMFASLRRRKEEKQ